MPPLNSPLKIPPEPGWKVCGAELAESEAMPALRAQKQKLSAVRL